MLRASSLRCLSSSATRSKQVAVLGAAGGIGQPLALLLKANFDVTGLSLYDVAPVTPGVAADLSHIDTKAKVTGFVGDDIDKAVTGADIILIPAGVPRKPGLTLTTQSNHVTQLFIGMTRDDLFNTNATIVATLATACAKHAPDAVVGIISNPVNSTVPITYEIYKKLGVRTDKIYGVTTLDCVRANEFVGALGECDPLNVHVPVVGGHAGATIIPLLSQSRPEGVIKHLGGDQIKTLTERIQNAGTEVVQAKAGGGSATLSMAYAASRFANSVIQAMHGVEVVECVYIPNPQVDGVSVDYFATPCAINQDGTVKLNLGLGPMNEFEQTLVDEAQVQLKGEISKGVEFAGNFSV
jgi:malate dehydrogenase